MKVLQPKKLIKKKRFWQGVAVILVIFLGLVWYAKESLGLLFIYEKTLVPAAIFLNHNNPHIHFASGNYYFGGGAYDIEKAKEKYFATIALDDRYPGAHYQLSRVYFIEGRFYEALAEINKELGLSRGIFSAIIQA